MIKREVIEKIGYLDTELTRGADGNYWRRLCQRYEVDYIPEILANIHIAHSERISTISSTGLTNEAFTLEKRIRVFANEFKKYHDRHFNILILLAMNYFLLRKPRIACSYLKIAFRCKASLASKTKYFLSNIIIAIARWRILHKK